MKLGVFVLLGSLLAGGCLGGQTGGETGLQPSGGGPGTGGTGGTGGSDTGGSDSGGVSTGGSDIGADECQKTADCTLAAEQALAPLSEPSPLRRTFASSECTPVSVERATSPTSTTSTVVGYGCSCLDEEGGSMTAGPPEAGCSVVGRGGDCLWDGSVFTGCSLSEPELCRPVCDELEARLTADADRTFTTRVLYAVCENRSCHSVVEIDGRCFADGSYLTGQAYDCSLGAEAILELHEQAAADPDPAIVVESVDAPLIDGFVELAVTRGFSGTEQRAGGFGVYSQFYEQQTAPGVYGTVVDPVDGLDQCGAIRRYSVPDSAEITSWAKLDRVTLIDESARYPLEEFESGGLYAYTLDLGALEVEPRYGGEYGLEGSGGGFEPFAIEGIVLPEALSVPELEAASRFARGALDLTWTGRSPHPLRILLTGSSWPLDAPDSGEIECWVTDDGEFAIPADVLQGFPAGFVTATFWRRQRLLAELGTKTLAVSGILEVTHRFSTAETCERADVREACQRYAERYRSQREACGATGLPTVESMCPEHETQSCHLCPEYYDCAASNTVCGEDGIYLYDAGCTCP